MLSPIIDGQEYGQDRLRCGYLVLPYINRLFYWSHFFYPNCQNYQDISKLKGNSEKSVKEINHVPKGCATLSLFRHLV